MRKVIHALAPTIVIVWTLFHLAQEAKMELQAFQHDMDKLLITLFLSQNAGINISDTLALKSFRGVAYQYNFTIHAFFLNGLFINLIVKA